MAKNRRKRARGESACYSYLTTGGKNLRWRVEPVGGGPGGKAGFKTQAEALAWLAANKGRPAAPGTVGEWLAKWLELHRAEWAPKTLRYYKFRVEKWLAPALGAVRLRDLTGLHVKDMLAGMHREEKGDDERHKAGRTLRTALNAAVALGVLGANPMTLATGRVKLPTPRPKEKPTFTPEQVRKLLDAADARGVGHVVRLWLDAGLRPGEMLGLDWEHLDLEKGTVRVLQSLDADKHDLRPTKTRGSRRTLRLSEATVASLKAAAGAGVFLGSPTSEGGRFWESAFYRDWWRPLLKAAKLDGLGFAPYSCRHTMATHLLRLGKPIKAVSRRLGHDDILTTLRVYAHCAEGDDADLASVMGDLLS